MGLGRGLKYYFLEFAVIVAGVSVSFLIGEWGTQKDDRKQELRLLSNLQRDLAMDTVILATEATATDTLISTDQVYILGNADCWLAGSRWAERTQ